MSIYTKKQAFTLVEIIIVIIIVWIMLSMTFSLWFSYVTKMRVKTDKEWLLSTYNVIQASARSSNYYQWEKYQSVLTTFTAWSGESIQHSIIELDSTIVPVRSFSSQHGSITLVETTESGDPVVVTTAVVPTSVVTTTPYKIWCMIGWSDEITTLWITYTSAINDDEYCFEIDAWSCKLKQVECP
jgi:type II secretory pathway pseudopilin PulG